MAQNLYGVIYLSTAKLELLIVDMKSRTVIERVSSASFVQVDDKSKIYQAELEKIVFSLNGFRQLLKDYKVKNCRFLGSRQLIDDTTARYLSDQFLVRTGFEIHWLNLGEITYFRAAALMGLHEFDKITEGTTYLLYIGASSTTLSKFKNHQFINSWNVNPGYLDLDKMNQGLRNIANDPGEIINDYIGSKLEYLRREIAAEEPGATLVLQDFDWLNGKYLPDSKVLVPFDLDKLKTMRRDLREASPQYIAKHFPIEENNAMHVVFGLSVMHHIIRAIKPADVWLTRQNILDGLAISSMARLGYIKRDFTQMTLTAATTIAERYLVESKHRDNTTKLALHLFDQLKRLHRLGPRERLLLEVAIQVTNIGSFISLHGHYRHSAYIMEANPIIGLSDQENRIIAEIARYHSSESPGTGAYHYATLDGAIQMPIAKLVAILRLADALDDSHQQKIPRISVSLRDDKVIITAYSSHDLALEKWAFAQKSQLFREVYGIPAVLKQRRTTA